MRQTLFYIPGRILEVPVFGIGWLLLLWLLVAAWMAWRNWRQHRQWKEVASIVPLVAIVAAVITLLIPRILEPVPPGFLTIPPVDQVRVGLPIRGYGVMLMVAVISGVALAANRAARAGLNPEVIYSLALAMIVFGILGARLFFVIQYWEEIRGPTFRDTLVNLVSFVKGGLVVYGSLIGAALGFVWYGRRRKLPLLPLADLIAPSLALGLAIGRLGCLLNGCCYGGVCAADFPIAVSFPAGSPPYLDQLASGQLLGIQFDHRLVVQSVDENRWPELRAGSRVIAINQIPVSNIFEVQQALVQSTAPWNLRLQSGVVTRSTAKLSSALQRSLPVHPTQIYSSVNAVLIAVLATLYFPLRRRHGEVIAGGLTLYAATRYLLELIRVDEGSFVGLMTISQTVSVLLLLGLLAGWFLIFRQPRLRNSDPT